MPFVEVYRSNRSACEHRAFVLFAVGIESDVIAIDNAFAVLVAAESADTALDQLQRYDAENTATEPLRVAPKLFGHAWIAPLLYLAALLGVSYSAGENFFGVDWYDIGALHSSVQHSRQWWRLVTALTLHVDAVHLLGNCIFGVFFSYLAAQMLGYGVAWASIVFAAAIANLVDSLLMPSMQVTLGASTAVFATLGLIAAYSWQQRISRPGGDMRQWLHAGAPLIAGITVLALIGAGGEHTDVLAHLAGFICGATLGALYIYVPQSILDRLATQVITATIATASIVGAWSWAIRTLHPIADLMQSANLSAK